jgi:hypothetical protein
MVNIMTLKYSLRFLEETSFMEEPELAIFKSVFKRLRTILCIKPYEACIGCSQGSKCVYSYLTAGDFHNLSQLPFKLHRPIFTKRTMKVDNILDLKLTLLGDAIKHMDFIDFTVKEFEARGLFKERHRFLIADRKVEELNLDRVGNKITSIKILTPIERKDQIFAVEKVKLDNLNQLYHITDHAIDSIDVLYDFQAIEFKIRRHLNLGVAKLLQDGYVGIIRFSEPVSNSILLDLMTIIGVGEFYALGGGAIEACKHD